VQAGPALDYLDDTAYYLNEPGRYVQAVLGQDGLRLNAAQAAGTAAAGTTP
jgi:hypothetical protein